MPTCVEETPHTLSLATDFPVGAKVAFKRKPGACIGIVYKNDIEKHAISVDFYATNKNEYYEEGYHFGISSYHIADLIVVSPPVPLKEKIATKCKDLWNKSNYVNKNKQAAY